MVNSLDWKNLVNLHRGDVVYGIHQELDKIWTAGIPTYCNVSNWNSLYQSPSFKDKGQYDLAKGDTERYKQDSSIHAARPYKSYIDQVLICTRGRVFFVLDGVIGIQYLTQTAEERFQNETINKFGLMVTFRELKHAVKLIILDTQGWLKNRFVFIEGGVQIPTAELFNRIDQRELSFYTTQLRNQYKNILWYWAGKEWNGGQLTQQLTEKQAEDPTEIKIGHEYFTPLFFMDEHTDPNKATPAENMTKTSPIPRSNKPDFSTKSDTKKNPAN